MLHETAPPSPLEQVWTRKSPIEVALIGSFSGIWGVLCGLALFLLLIEEHGSEWQPWIVLGVMTAAVTVLDSYKDFLIEGEINLKPRVLAKRIGRGLMMTVLLEIFALGAHAIPDRLFNQEEREKLLSSLLDPTGIGAEHVQRNALLFVVWWSLVAVAVSVAIHYVVAKSFAPSWRDIRAAIIAVGVGLAGVVLNLIFVQASAFVGSWPLQDANIHNWINCMYVSQLWPGSLIRLIEALILHSAGRIPFVIVIACVLVWISLSWGYGKPRFWPAATVALVLFWPVLSLPLPAVDAVWHEVAWGAAGSTGGSWLLLMLSSLLHDLFHMGAVGRLLISLGLSALAWWAPALLDRSSFFLVVGIFALVPIGLAMIALRSLYDASDQLFSLFAGTIVLWLLIICPVLLVRWLLHKRSKGQNVLTDRFLPIASCACLIFMALWRGPLGIIPIAAFVVLTAPWARAEPNVSRSIHWPLLAAIFVSLAVWASRGVTLHHVFFDLHDAVSLQTHAQAVQKANWTGLPAECKGCDFLQSAVERAREREYWMRNTVPKYEFELKRMKSGPLHPRDGRAIGAALDDLYRRKLELFNDKLYLQAMPAQAGETFARIDALSKAFGDVGTRIAAIANDPDEDVKIRLNLAVAASIGFWIMYSVMLVDRGLGRLREPGEG